MDNGSVVTSSTRDDQTYRPYNEKRRKTRLRYLAQVRQKTRDFILFMSNGGSFKYRKALKLWTGKG